MGLSPRDRHEPLQAALGPRSPRLRLDIAKVSESEKTMKPTLLSRIGPILPLCLVVTATPCLAYTYKSSDFASTVVEYVQGTGATTDIIDGQPYNNPQTALGRPSIDSTGDRTSIPVDQTVPVNQVYCPYRSFEVVSIGNDGRLILDFGHRVGDDPRNPYGIDLIVYGNGCKGIFGGGGWTNGDPAGTTIGNSYYTEPGRVSVSQDGQTWYAFDTGPYADDFAPTLGRTYDPDNPDTSIGEWNLWWGQPTDPTKPLNPSLSWSSLSNKTVAQACSLYGDSAGGAGFDIANLGLTWFRYVKVEDADIAVSEIDAVADVAPVISTPGDHDADGLLTAADIDLLAANYGDPDYDLDGDDLTDQADTDHLVRVLLNTEYGDANLDGAVSLGDLSILASNYGTTSGMGWVNGDFNGDRQVSLGDLAILATHYGYGVHAPAGTTLSFEDACKQVFGDQPTALKDDPQETDPRNPLSPACGLLGAILVGMILFGGSLLPAAANPAQTAHLERKGRLVLSHPSLRPGQKNRAKSPSPIARGFTLIELLVVVAIISLLVAILLPAMNQARSLASGTFCRNNLRQFAIAAQTYTESYSDRYPIAYYYGYSPAFKSYSWDFVITYDAQTTVEAGILWQGRTIEQVHQCPSFDGNANSYGDPYTGYNYNTSYIGHGSYETVVEPARTGEVGDPAGTALFGDGQYIDGANKYMRSPFTHPGDRFAGRYGGTQGYRHSGATNVAFCDGHVVSQNQRYTEVEPAYNRELITPDTGFLSPDNSVYDLE